MLAQVKSGFSMAGGIAPPLLSFVGSSTSIDSSTVNMPAGIAPGDIGFYFDVMSRDGATPPVDTLPSGWTRIGSTLTDAPIAGGDAGRLNAAYRELDGTETTLTGMAGTYGPKGVLVFRKSPLLTWGAPSGVQAQFEGSGVTDKTITVGSAPLVVVGYTLSNQSTTFAMSPVQAGAIHSGNSSLGYLHLGYLIHVAPPSNNTVDADLGLTQAIGGFYVALT